MTGEESLEYGNYLRQNSQAFHASLVEDRIAQVLFCLGDFGQALVLRQAMKWWQSADWVPDNAVNRTELGGDARKYKSLFYLRYAKEVAKIREAVNDNFGTSFSDAEIVQVIQFTILRHGGAHANLTLAKPFPVLQAGITQAVGVCAEPWPDAICSGPTVDPGRLGMARANCSWPGIYSWPGPAVDPDIHGWPAIPCHA